jgi:predicted enzyme related to lactoylglutathione lyase
VNGSIHASPIANNDTYNWIGNTTLDSAAAGLPGLFANDTAPLGEAIHLVSNTNPAHGSVVINADGTFVYTPNANTTHVASDSFTYTINNTAIPGATSTGTVTINFAGSVWYVDDSLASNGSGTIASKFNSLASAVSAATTGDTIFLYKGNANYGAVTLTANQKLIGQGVDLTFDDGFSRVTLVAKGSGNTPTIGGTVTLANNNTVEGLNISSGTSTGLSGSSVSGETVSQVSVTSTTGTAVNLSSVGGAFTFTSISANGTGGTSGDGIVLQNTTGSFTVTGTGSAGSGGTIQHEHGADGAVAGSGIYMSSAQNVSFSWMQLNDFDNFGIRGTNVTGFTLDHTIINGTNGTTALGGSEEGAVRFDGLFGSASISNSTLGGTGANDSSFSDDLRLTNSSGTLDRLMISNTSFGKIGSGGNNGLTVSALTSATIKVSVTDCTFTNAIGTLADFTVSNNTTMDLVFRSNALSNNNVNQASGGGGFTLQGGAGATNVTYDIENNTFKDAIGIALLVATGNGGVNWSGQIVGNTIGLAGTSLSGSTQASGIKVKATGSGTHTTLIANNVVHQTNEEGIFIQNNDGSATLNASVFGNTVDTPGSFSFAGLNVDVGAISTDTSVVNLVVGSAATAAQQNDFSTGDPANFSDVNFSQQFSTVINLSKNGSSAGTVTQVIKDDNKNAAATAVATSGTVNLVTTLPTTPATVTLGAANPAAGTVGVSYNQSLSASGGSGSYTFALVGGSLPAGLSLSSAGVLSGTLTAGGSFSFTASATDTSTPKVTGTQTYTLTVNAPAANQIALSPASLAAGTVGAIYSQSITASGSTTPFHFTISAGSLPPGLFLNQDTGVISGVPTTASGSPFNFTVQATDSSTGTGPFSNTKSYSISVANPTVSLSSINIGALPASSGNNSETIVYQATINNTLTPADAIKFTTQGSVSGSFAGSPILTDDPNDANGTAGTDPTVVHLIPIVNSSTANLAANAVQLIITGSGFDDVTPSNNVVTFNRGTGTVTAATNTQLTVTSLSGLIAGSLTASVSVQGTHSGSPVQVATVTPVVTMNTANLAINATQVVINGFGFDPTAANNTVVFNDGAVGSVTAASNTSLTVTFSTKPTNVGTLTAVVTTNNVSSGTAVQVATVTPAVTMSTANLAANATQIVIAGFGFDPTAANNSVVFNDSAVGSVTTASATSLTVTFSTKPTSAGSLTAVVTTDNVSSGNPVQVATVTPVVTSSTAFILTTGATVTINGFGFDSANANNSVAFNLGAAGNVTTSSPTQLVVTFTTKPTVGNLTAVVTANGVSSGPAVQVATVIDLTVTPTAVSATEGSPFSGQVATFTEGGNTNPTSDYTATIHWGDAAGSATDTAGNITQPGGSGTPYVVTATTTPHTYAEEGSYTFTVTITNTTANASVSNNGTANVADAALTAGALTPPSATEGQSTGSVVLFHFTDADPNGTISDYTATVTWGDGTTETSVANPATVQVVAHTGGGFDVLGSHTYAEELSGQTFSVSVSDVGGASTSASNSAFSVADAALTAGALTPPTATENVGFSNVVLFHFTDANAAATVSDFTATVTWGDGATETSAANPTDVQVVTNAGGGFDVLGSHTYAEELSGATFSVSVADNGATPASASTSTFSVADAALTAGALTPPSATERQPTGSAVLFHFTDANSAATVSDFTATVTWGDGKSNTSADGSGTVSVIVQAGGGFDVVGSHTYAEELSGATFSVSVADNGATPASASVSTFSVADAALTAGAMTPPSATEGQSTGSVVLFHFTDADPGATASDFTATVTWGDGATENSTSNPAAVKVVANSGGFDVLGSHTYAEEASGLTFSVSVSDVGGAAPVSASTSTFSVVDAALTAGALTPPSITAGIPVTNAVLFHFTDGNPSATASDYTATVTWGDGVTENSAANPADVKVVANGGGFDVVGSHAYTSTVSGLTFSVSVVDVGGAGPVGGSAVVNVSGDLVIMGTNGDDVLVLTSTGPDSGTYSLNGAPAVSFSHASTFTFNGQGGNDTLILNLANGVPVVSGAVQFDGGPGTDALLVNASGLTARTRPGVVSVAGAQNQTQRVTYANAETMQLNGLAAVDAFAGPDTADRATAFAGLSAQERFVQALYLNELGRAGAKFELDAWAALFNAPGVSGQQAQGLIAGGHRTQFGGARPSGPELVRRVPGPAGDRRRGGGMGESVADGPS